MKLPRARHYRILSQALFLFAFLALFWGLAEPRVPAAVASILLAIDPLTAVGTALSDWTIAGWTWIGLVVLVLTISAYSTYEYSLWTLMYRDLTGLSEAPSVVATEPPATEPPPSSTPTDRWDIPERRSDEEA